MSRLFEGIVPEDQPGFRGSTLHDVLDDGDMPVEIADWESSEARDRYMQESAASCAFAPLMVLCATPAKATVLRELS